MNDRKLYEIDEGGASHWVVATTPAEALRIAQRDFADVCGEQLEGEPYVSVCTRAELQVVTDVDGVLTMSPAAWVRWMGGVGYLAFSEF
jgi:predicted ATPase